MKAENKAEFLAEQQRQFFPPSPGFNSVVFRLCVYQAPPRKHVLTASFCIWFDPGEKLNPSLVLTNLFELHFICAKRPAALY